MIKIIQYTVCSMYAAVSLINKKLLFSFLDSSLDISLSLIWFFVSLQQVYLAIYLFNLLDKILFFCFVSSFYHFKQALCIFYPYMYFYFVHHCHSKTEALLDSASAISFFPATPLARSSRRWIFRSIFIAFTWDAPNLSLIIFKAFS